jgi:hypothetical protein
MDSREALEKRVTDLERQVSALRAGGRVPGIRKRASWGVGDVPVYDIAVGPDPERGEARGHARGIVAIGDVATGVLAIGGLARGGVAVGGLALGLVSFGGLSIGLLGAVGAHVIDARRRDPEAERFFREHGLATLTEPRRSPWPRQ